MPCPIIVKKGGTMTLRYTKNIVTDTKEYTPEEMAKIEQFRKDNPTMSTIEMMRLLWMDDTKVAGAKMYMECVWLWGGVTTSGTTEEPHHHDFDEVIGFISTNPDHPKDLDARMEIILGDETHFLTKSCLVHVPAGMKHCPLTFREVNRPVFFFTLAPISQYGRTSETVKPKEGKPKAAAFVPPPPDASGSRYARYIITEPKPWPKTSPEKPRTAKTTQVVSLDSGISPGAFYADFVWIWSGNTDLAEKPHSHNFDEMIGIIGSNRKYPRKVGGDVTIAMGNETHTINQSSLIYIPKGLVHCPLQFSNIKEPVLCFSIGNTQIWSKEPVS
jgi:hypothetical protein